MRCPLGATLTTESAELKLGSASWRRPVHCSSRAPVVNHTISACTELQGVHASLWDGSFAVGPLRRCSLPRLLPAWLQMLRHFNDSLDHHLGFAVHFN